jgi:glutamate-1-semialdehyde 2,1-aminomutase
VFFAGTFNAHPISLAATMATINQLENGTLYEQMEQRGERVRKSMSKLANDHSLDVVVTGYKSVFVTYFMKPPLNDYSDLLRNDEKMFVNYRKEMIKRGVFMLPRNLKRNSVCASHTDEDIDITIQAADESLKRVKQESSRS